MQRSRDPCDPRWSFGLRSYLFYLSPSSIIQLYDHPGYDYTHKNNEITIEVEMKGVWQVAHSFAGLLYFGFQAAQNVTAAGRVAIRVQIA